MMRPDFHAAAHPEAVNGSRHCLRRSSCRDHGAALASTFGRLVALHRPALVWGLWNEWTQRILGPGFGAAGASAPRGDEGAGLWNYPGRGDSYGALQHRKSTGLGNERTVRSTLREPVSVEQCAAGRRCGGEGVLATPARLPAPRAPAASRDSQTRLTPRKWVGDSGRVVGDGLPRVTSAGGPRSQKRGRSPRSASMDTRRGAARRGSIHVRTR